MADNGINFKIGVDTSEAEKGIIKVSDSADKAGKKVDDLSDKMDQLGKSSSEAGSKIDEVNDKVVDLTDNLDKATDATKESSKSVEELGESSKSLENLEDKLDLVNKNLVSIKDSIDNTNNSQREHNSTIDEGSQKLEKHNSVLVKLLGGQEKYNAVMDALPPKIKDTIKGIEGMISASKAFIATPIGICLGVIALALATLTTWFRNSSEGEMAFAKITGYVSGVLNQLKEIAIKTGETLYNVFKNPKKAVEDLWKSIRQNLVNRVEGLGKTFMILGKMITKVFSGDFDADSWKKLGKQLADATAETATGVDHLTDKVKKYGKEVANAAEKSAKLNEREKQLARDRSNWSVEEQKIDNKLAKLRDSNASGGDRAKNQAEAQDLVNKKYAQRLKFAKEELEIQQERIKLTSSTDADFERENELKKEVLKIEEERTQEMLRFNRAAVSAENASLRALNKQSKFDAKSTKDDAKANEEAYKIKADQARKEEQLALQTRQNILDTEKDGNAKRLKQIQLDYDKIEQEIKEREEDIYEQNYQNAKRVWEANNSTPFGDNRNDYKVLTVGQTAELESARKANSVARDRAIKQIQKEANDAMNEYLKIYGSFEEKLNAINAEYTSKMENAQNIGDKMMIKQQWDEAISNLNVEDLNEKLGWDVLFGELENLAIDKLEEIKQALHDALDVKDITAENAKVITDQLNKVQGQIAKKQSSWAELFPNSGIASVIAQKQQKNAEYKIYEKEYNQASKEKFDAELAINGFKESISELFKELDIIVKKDEINVSNAEKLQKTYIEGGGQKTEQLTNAMSNLAESTNKASSANKSMSAASTKMQGAKGGGGFAQTIAILDAIFTGIHENVESLRGFLKDLGKENTSFGKKFSTMADSYDNAFKGWESFKKGDVVGTIRNNYEAWNKMFDVFEPNNMKELNDEIEHLTYATQDLQKAFNTLLKNIEESTLYDANENYDKAKKNLELQEQNTRKIMQDEAAKWEHGSHSISAQLNDDAGFLNAIQKAGAIVGKSFVTSGGFLSGMTGTDYEKLRSENTALYTLIKNYYRDAENKHTGSGIADMFDTMAESFGSEAMQNLEDTINKTLSGITFDSLESNFLTTLNDMESDVDTFGDNLEDTLRKAIIKGVMKDHTSELEQWYTEFSNAMAGGLSNAEASALRAKYQQITNMAVSERDAALKSLGLDDDSKITASQRSAASMSEDTASELNGRFTALQIAGNSIDTNLKSLTQDIRSNTKETHRLLNKILDDSDEIIENTGTSATQEVKATLDVDTIHAEVDTSKLQSSIDSLANAVNGIPNLSVSNEGSNEKDSIDIQNIITQIDSALTSVANGNAQNVSILTGINSSISDAVSMMNNINATIGEGNSILSSINLNILACNGTLNAIYNTNDAGFRNLQNEIRSVASAINSKL